MPPAKKANETPPKTCFVVAEFGSSAEARKRSEQTLRHLVRKVLEPLSYDVVRADEITTPGLITHQIIERLLDSDLVVADLTGNNPNVFYEIAVRHAVAKPIIHILTDGESIPFDVKDVRTVYYSLSDPDMLENAREQFKAVVEEVEKSPDEDKQNPVAVVRHLRLLEGSTDPQTAQIGEVLAAVASLGEQVRTLGALVRPRLLYTEGPDVSVANRFRASVLGAIRARGNELMSTEEVARELGASLRSTARALEDLAQRERVYWLEDSRGKGWSTVPI